MQVSLNAERVVRQYGASLGALEGCTIEDIPTEETEAALLAALASVVGDGGVTLSTDLTGVRVVPPSAAWQEAEAARMRADEALRAAVLAHPDPVVTALAQRAGII